eukprot:5638535-Lingulodinium_polyedra.AAC.1
MRVAPQASDARVGARLWVGHHAAAGPGQFGHELHVVRGNGSRSVVLTEWRSNAAAVRGALREAQRQISEDKA